MTEKIPVVTVPEFTIYIEWSDIGPVLHGDVHVPWTKTIKNKAIDAVDALCRELNQPAYAAHFEKQGAKHRKFLKMLGFVPFLFVTNEAGDQCVIYRKFLYG